jgi:hypothetical protein
LSRHRRVDFRTRTYLAAPHDNDGNSSLSIQIIDIVYVGSDRSTVASDIVYVGSDRSTVASDAATIVIALSSFISSILLDAVSSDTLS